MRSLSPPTVMVADREVAFLPSGTLAFGHRRDPSRPRGRSSLNTGATRAASFGRVALAASNPLRGVSLVWPLYARARIGACVWLLRMACLAPFAVL